VNKGKLKCSLVWLVHKKRLPVPNMSNARTWSSRPSGRLMGRSARLPSTHNLWTVSDNALRRWSARRSSRPRPVYTLLSVWHTRSNTLCRRSARWSARLSLPYDLTTVSQIRWQARSTKGVILALGGSIGRFFDIKLVDACAKLIIRTR
jgi:hypothetical protein